MVKRVECRVVDSVTLGGCTSAGKPHREPADQADPPGAESFPSRPTGPASGPYAAAIRTAIYAGMLLDLVA